MTVPLKCDWLEDMMMMTLLWSLTGRDGSVGERERLPYSRWYKTFLVCISMIESPFLRFCEWFKVASVQCMIQEHVGGVRLIAV